MLIYGFSSHSIIFHLYYTFMLITWFWLAEKAWIKYTADRKNITTVRIAW
jgi:hypothetical protein